MLPVIPAVRRRTLKFTLEVCMDLLVGAGIAVLLWFVLLNPKREAKGMLVQIFGQTAFDTTAALTLQSCSSLQQWRLVVPLLERSAHQQHLILCPALNRAAGHWLSLVSKAASEASSWNALLEICEDAAPLLRASQFNAEVCMIVRGAYWRLALLSDPSTLPGPSESQRRYWVALLQPYLNIELH